MKNKGVSGYVRLKHYTGTDPYRKGQAGEETSTSKQNISGNQDRRAVSDKIKRGSWEIWSLQDIKKDNQHTSLLQTLLQDTGEYFKKWTGILSQPFRQ